MSRITIEPVTRIEGHAKITIHLGDDGRVTDTEFHVTQVRGFEKFVEGRPYYEMPGITARICGICPVSHQLASAKACDAIMAVRIPRAARVLRELLHCAQTVQSHALSFFYLASPDLLLGMDFDPALRNVVGVVERYPELARDGIELRKFGLQLIEGMAQERVHSAWVVPGGVNTALSAAVRERALADLPRALAIAEHTLELFKGKLDALAEEIACFGSWPTMYAGLVDATGRVQLYDGALRFRGPEGEIVEDGVAPELYANYIGEATLKNSYLKAPFFRPKGYPDGLYRVGPLARLNVADAYSTPRADAEFDEFRERFGHPAHSAMLYHYARLIEIVYCLERIRMLLDDPQILDKHVRATAGVNASEGIGVIEAPRGLLIHHYKVNEDGAMVWANLIVATGHNNLAIGRGIRQVAEKYVHGDKVEEGMLNRVSALVRAYDPCLSCSTHAIGQIALRVRVLDAAGKVVRELASE